MRRVVACVALFVLVVTANAQTGGPAIEGQVVDVSGAGISYAHVIIHPDPAFRREPAQDVVITTDIRGRFVAKVPGGFCDVFVAAPTFKPVAMKVRVLGLEKHSL